MKVNRIKIVSIIIQYLSVAIGLALIVYGFINDDDFKTLLGVALEIFAFYLYVNIKSSQKRV